MVHATFTERPKFLDGLKSESLARWVPAIGRRVEKITLLQQFVVYTWIVLGVTVIGVGTWMSARIDDAMIGSNAGGAALYLAGYIEPYVQSVGPDGNLSPEDRGHLAAARDKLARRRHIESLKIWRADGTMLFGNREELIGRKFPDAAIRPSVNGDIRVALANFDDEDSEFERTLHKPLYEVFAPLYRNGTGEIIAVAEFYEAANELEETSAIRNRWLFAGSSALGMFGVLLAMVGRGSARIERQKSLLKSKLREESRLRRTNGQLNKRIREALTETARIDDLAQRRLGAELHDGPAQSLAFVLLRLDEIEACSAAHPSRAIIDEVRRATAEALTEIRAISNDLFFPADDTNDLISVLRAVIGSHEQRARRKVRFEAQDVPNELPPEVVRCVARVVQEALNNSAKHAGAAHREVFARVENDCLVVSIVDDGPGIERATFSAEKLGMKGMRYRVEAVDGVFELASNNARGLKVCCRIPIVRETQDRPSRKN
jgi:signal transduction histidine kinase